MSNLLPGENLVLKQHPHWIVPVNSIWLPIVAVVLVVIADFTILLDNYNSWNLPPRFRTFFTLAWSRLRVCADRRVDSLAVHRLHADDQRIKIETGVFGRQEKIIPIDRIQDCTTKMSLLGRMLGYGRVEVDAAGAQAPRCSTTCLTGRFPRPGLHAVGKAARRGSGWGATCGQSERRLKTPQSNRKPLALLGFMGSGKSVVGALVARPDESAALSTSM